MKTIQMCAYVLIAGLFMTSPVMAEGHGGGGGRSGGGHGGHSGGGGHGGHSGGHRHGGNFSIGFYGGYPYYGYPYYGDPFFYGYPYYYNPSVIVTTPPTPPTYIEQSPPAQTQELPNGYWYFCTQPEGYYPYIQECQVPWQAVPPTPDDNNR